MGARPADSRSGAHAQDVGNSIVAVSDDRARNDVLENEAAYGEELTRRHFRPMLVTDVDVVFFVECDSLVDSQRERYGSGHEPDGQDQTDTYRYFHPEVCKKHKILCLLKNLYCTIVILEDYSR